MHPNTSIGNNCTVLQQVTIGNNTKKSIDRVAVIGDRVVISAGAKIIGPLTIGDDVIIGANAVVTKSFGENCIIAGVPAKIINSND
jgi:serine O-acetyltransferase